jgi:hypothetical protein
VDWAKTVVDTRKRQAARRGFFTASFLRSKNNGTSWLEDSVGVRRILRGVGRCSGSLWLIGDR